ncbi:heterokaryon incompatibility protein-domain-containing protein [Podospora conica]|nr:heterokaryon incompatibility protein-domain-containing protein [Schizothecium conicum]
MSTSPKMSPSSLMSRLTAEHRLFSEEPTPGIKIVPRSENLRHLDVEIAGSDQSPYQENWSTVLHIDAILLSIQALLSAPNPDDPLDAEIGKKWKDNEALAIKTAAEWTRQYATPRSAQAERLPGDPLAGTIQHIVLPIHDLEFSNGIPTPSYEALSYTWGAPGVTDQLYLHSRRDAHDPGQPQQAHLLGLGENCALALRRLRFPDRERLMWVDAICINQNDIGERSAQVRIMHHIYKTASRVLIYLGEGDSDTDAAITILEDDANGRRHRTTDEPATDGHNNLEVLQLMRFFSLPWFERVWVLQEVAWATTALAVCGSRAVPWKETLHPAYTSSISQILQLQPLPRALSFGDPRPDQPMTAKFLFEELLLARRCWATDPRDKIFALLELFHSRPNDKRLAIDYERGVCDLYTDVAEYLMENLGLDVLAAVPEPCRIPGLPTWAVDWTFTPTFRQKYSFNECFAGGTGASSRPEFVIQQVQSADTVTLRRGLRVRAAHLHTAGTSSRSFDFPRSYSITEMSWPWKQYWYLAENVPVFEQLLEHIERVVSGTVDPRDRFDVDRPAPDDMLGFQQRWNTELKRTNQITTKLTDRRVFTTESGLPAMGPHRTKGGDRIFALEGASMCHVLRPTDQAGVFNYVGDCFLYGHMQLRRHGKAERYDVGDAEGDPVPWEEIVIV